MSELTCAPTGSHRPDCRGDDRAQRPQECVNWKSGTRSKKKSEQDRPVIVLASSPGDQQTPYNLVPTLSAKVAESQPLAMSDVRRSRGPLCPLKPVGRQNSWFVCGPRIEAARRLATGALYSYPKGVL